MTVAELKSEITALAARSGTLRKDTERSLGDAIKGLALELEKANPTADPTRRTDLFAGRWELLYSTFTLERQTDLRKLSFGKLPAATATVVQLFQEVSPEGDTVYDNIVELTDRTGKPLTKVMKGRYAVHDGHRLDVEFLHVFVAASDGRSPAQLAADLGVAPDAPLSVAVGSMPPLWSAIIYLDEDMRINRGINGGVYVLRKIPGPFALSRLRDPTAQ